MEKVLIVFHDNDILSGATRSMITLLDRFVESKKFEIEALIPNKEGTLDAFLMDKGIVVHRATYGGNVYSATAIRVKKTMAYWRCFAKSVISYASCVGLVARLKKNKPDIIYTNTSTIYFGAWLSEMLRTKHIWHFREYCLEDQRAKRIFAKTFLKLANKANAIITISEKLDAYYREKYQLKNTTMLYDDISKEYLCDEKTCHEGYNFLITGSLAASKGQKIAIQAIETLNDPNAALHIAGRINKYGEELQQYVSEKKIDHIVFCGLVSDMSQLRKKIDFSIVAANSEAFGRTIIEDMLAGVVVIGCSTGSVPELIQDHQTGFLYRYGDVVDLKEKMKYAITHPDEVEMIRKKAKEFAVGFTQHVTASAIIERMERFEC